MGEDEPPAPLDPCLRAPKIVDANLLRCGARTLAASASVRSSPATLSPAAAGEGRLGVLPGTG